MCASSQARYYAMSRELRGIAVLLALLVLVCYVGASKRTCTKTNYTAITFISISFVL